MGGRIKSAAIGAACIVLGLGVARAGLAHASAGAPAAAPGPSSGGGIGYDVVALVVVALVVTIAISLYWRHRARELLGAEADLADFKRRRGFALRDLWECPLCNALMRLEAVAGHQNPDYSFCAYFDAWLAENENGKLGEFIRGFRPNWQQDQNVSKSGGDPNATIRVSATMAPEHSYTTGEYDTLNPGAGRELEE